MSPVGDGPAKPSARPSWMGRLRGLLRRSHHTTAPDAFTVFSEPPAGLSYAEDALVPYNIGNTFHIAYVNVLRNPAGDSVWVCAPASEDSGFGQVNYVENLAEAIRQSDPAARMLFVFWPLADKPVTSLDQPCAIRVTFAEAYATTQPPSPKVTVLGDDPEGGPGSPGRVLAQYSLSAGGGSRFRGPQWFHFTEDAQQQVEELLWADVPVLGMSQYAITRRVEATFPEWPRLHGDSRRTSHESMELLLAIEREWNTEDD